MPRKKKEEPEKVSAPPSQEKVSFPYNPNPVSVTPGDEHKLPKRLRSRELFPESWKKSTLKLRINGGEGTEIIKGTLLEICATGLVLTSGTGMVLVAWDFLISAELENGA